MSLPFTVLDSFTNKPFGGNPAAVIVLPEDRSLSDSLLQSIALEFNLSETAFIKRQDSGNSSTDYATFGLRWFTPQVEVDLCGHATLASAAVLFADESIVPKGINEIRFSTLSGILITRRVPGSSQIEMEFPVGDILPASDTVQTLTANSVLAATGLSAENVTFIGTCDVHPYHSYILVEVDPSVNLSSLKVVASHLGAPADARPITVVTNQVRTDDGSLSPSFNLRVFAPRFGIDEDPVTGSACSFATKYWAKKSGVGANKPFPVRQVSARVGDLDVVWNEEAGTAKLRGEARVATKGEIYIG